MTDNTAAAKAYIQQRLREWLDLFPGLHMSYYYESSSDVHFVKLDPDSYPMDDERFLEAQLTLFDDLIDAFPEHSVSTIHDPRFDHFLGEGTIEITHEYPATATPLSAAS
jgi:hypothetical protein